MVTKKLTPKKSQLVQDLTKDIEQLEASFDDIVDKMGKLPMVRHEYVEVEDNLRNLVEGMKHTMETL